MTTVFLDINDKIYVIKCLTYNITTKIYKIDTDEHETWESYIFCPPESARRTLQIYNVLDTVRKSPTSQIAGQLQPGNWKFPIKPRTEKLLNLLYALQEFTKFPHFNNTFTLNRHLLKEFNPQCQSSVSDDQATNPKRNKQLQVNQFNVEVSCFLHFHLAPFLWYQFYSGTLHKNLDVVLTIVELLL